MDVSAGMGLLKLSIKSRVDEPLSWLYSGVSSLDKKKGHLSIVCVYKNRRGNYPL